MNKKLLSSFDGERADRASATTSLTSCKDYDDDINNLQDRRSTRLPSRVMLRH